MVVGAIHAACGLELFRPLTRTVNMNRAGITLFLLLTIRAASASDLTGVVVDAGRKPLPGATVYIYTAFPKVGVSALCPSCYRDCGKHTSVDAAGGFHLDGLDPSLRFDLLAVADGYEPAFAHHTDPAKGPVTIELRPRSLADTDRLKYALYPPPHKLAIPAVERGR